MIHIAHPVIVIGGAGFLTGLVGGWLVRLRFEPSGEIATSDAPPSIAQKSTGQELRPDAPLLDRTAQEPQFDQLMLGIIDAIDEIQLMKSASPAEASRGLALIQGRLEDRITLANGELIRETIWNPAVQRAVKMEPPSAGQTDVRVLGTRATGLKHQGRVIRKQEVVISQP